MLLDPEDFFDEDFLDKETEERFDKLSKKQQKEFMKHFSKTTLEELERLSEDEDFEEENLLKIFQEIVEDSFKVAGERKDDWRGLPLLW